MPRALDVDSSGNVYVTGLFHENADMDPSALKTFNLTEFSNFGNDIFVVKLNNDGNFVWAVSLGGDLDDFSRAILVSGSDVLVAGHFTSESMDMDPGVADNFDIFNADTGTLDAFLWSLPQAVSYPVSDDISSSDLTLYKNGDLIELYDRGSPRLPRSGAVTTATRSRARTPTWPGSPARS